MAANVKAIVVTYESAEVLPACLTALKAEGVSAIVVDNASQDVSAEVARLFGAEVIRNARNEGYGRANNAGVARADSEFVLIVNPDLVVEPGCIAALVRAARRYPDAAIIAPKIVEPDGRVFVQPRSLLAPYLQNPKGVPCDPQGDVCIPFVSGACFMMRQQLFIQIGGFDEEIFLFYEDDDLCRRLTEAGMAIVYTPAAAARHLRGKSSAPAPGRIFRSRWHQAWSKAYVSRKYGLPDPSPATLALNGLKAAGAYATFRADLKERYGGSVAGALAWLKGRTALAHEGLTRRIGP